IWMIITTIKPYDQKTILNKIPKAREIKHENKTVYVGESSGRPVQGPGRFGPIQGGGSEGLKAVHFAGPRVVVFAEDEATIKRCVSAAARKATTGPLAAAIQKYDTSKHVYMAGAVNASLQQQIKGGGAMLPPQAKGVAPLLELTGGSMSMHFGDMF